MRNDLSAAMAAASPTPLAASYGDHIRRPMSRQTHGRYTSRPNLRRGEPLSQLVANGPSLPQSWKFSVGDSSDDELPVPPMKFSAEAKALLGVEASVMEGSSPHEKENGLGNGAREESRRPAQRGNLPLTFNTNIRERTASPISSRSGSPRIVRLNAKSPAGSSLRRAQSVNQGYSSPEVQRQKDLVTPGSRPRSIETFSPETRSGRDSTSGKERQNAMQSSVGSEAAAEPTSNSRENSGINDVAANMENLSLNKTKGDEIGTHTAQRQKRGLKVTGRFLSGPARRGIKRRQSEDGQSPVPQDLGSSIGAKYQATPGTLPSSDQDPPLDGIDGQDEPQKSQPNSSDPQRPAQVRFQSQASIITGSPEQRDLAPTKAPMLDSNENKPKQLSLSSPGQSSGKHMQPIFKMPSLPSLPSRFDQENEPPPTFKRNKPNGVGLSEKSGKMGVMVDEIMLAPTPASATPQRPALAARSQNTPHRPAPPPPKMTVLETATATGGAASASQARKKRNQYMSVNGKFFTRMDCIGRGGSSKVYRVMAENFKIFALKRVTLEDQDELAIQGYKGEIDLLRKLEKVERVVNLYDYEINEGKQTLSVLMEMGESDLDRIVKHRLNAEDAQLDVTFTRYFWKEMLSCVQSVHACGIVHSDLKPANFILLQGRLKLIDFGISNGIADNTVNVHREQHVGTPNYMSPEALIDSNAAAGLPATEGKMMKIGKPSDVWSLGCILYQMTYGKPPFAHIANQMQRCMAIPNPKHIISFPPLGIGNVPVPSGLIRTLRRCLNRDISMRPTVDELLGPADPFLNPDFAGGATVPVGQELIARMQQNIIKHVREKGIPSEAELATWPARFYASIKAAVEEGRA